MTLRKASLVFVALLGGCQGDPTHGASATAPSTGGEEDPAEVCDPKALCLRCASCFDECLCGGGDTATCAESCQDTVEPPEDAGGGAFLPPPMSATLVMDPFEIGPGEEVFRCQNYENPFGRNVAVLSTESFMTSGSHHMFVFQQADTGSGELEACGGLEFHSNLHGSQQSQNRTTYPPGIGRLLTWTEGLRLQVHYFNASSDTIHPEVAVTLQADEVEAVPTLASQIFINTLGINVPAQSNGEASSSCGIPKDVQLVSASSHMHSRGVYFTARSDDGQLLYETTEWAEPVPWEFEPPRALRAGSTIEINCQYVNESDQALSFGESADTNEMCIFSGLYYPAAFAEAITCLF